MWNFCSSLCLYYFRNAFFRRMLSFLFLSSYPLFLLLIHPSFYCCWLFASCWSIRFFWLLLYLTITLRALTCSIHLFLRPLHWFYQRSVQFNWINNTYLLFSPTPNSLTISELLLILLTSTRHQILAIRFQLASTKHNGTSLDLSKNLRMLNKGGFFLNTSEWAMIMSKVAIYQMIN